LRAELKKLLAERKSNIFKKWFDAILDTYPLETQRFLRREKDRFANPVKYNISEGIEGILKVLIEEEGDVSSFLDQVIRIRAVQDFSPSEALAFIFFLKNVIRDELKEEIKKQELFDELLEFESKIDKLALLSFNVYMQCREKLYEIRVNEIKRLTYSFLKRANLIYEIPDFKDYNLMR